MGLLGIIVGYALASGMNGGLLAPVGGTTVTPPPAAGDNAPPPPSNDKPATPDDDPVLGKADAPITLIEFTDYQCPFCGRVRQTVSQILEEYKGKVRYVIRDFPLSFHKDALKAHEGAHCAADQGKYWEMNKKLFADQSKIQVEDLKKYAAEIKLDAKKFADCLDSGKYTEKVRKSQEYGEKIGVSGTPAFFINGRMISGARPFEAFKEIIDDELRKD